MQEAGENYSDTEHTVPQLLNRFVAEGAKAERPHHCRSFRGAARPMGWHGVDVLLRIYAKCVVGHGDLAKRRISEVLRQN